MADLTSTITVKGTVNGKSVSFTHTYTLADVTDAALAHSGTTGTVQINAAAASDGDATLRSPEYAYAFIHNTSTNIPGGAVVTNTGAVTELEIPLCGGQFVIIPAIATDGMFGSSATAGDTALDVCDEIAARGLADFNIVPICSVFGASIAVS